MKAVLTKFALLRISPRGYGAVYLLMIPLFAFFYFLIERDFYHTTLLSNPTSEHERVAVVAGLSQATENWCNIAWASYFSINREEEFRSRGDQPLEFCSVQNSSVRFGDASFVLNGDLRIVSEKPAAFAELRFETAIPFGLPTLSTLDKGHGWSVIETYNPDRPLVSHLEYQFKYERYGLFRNQVDLLLEFRRNTENAVVAQAFIYNGPLVVEIDTLDSMLNYAFASHGDASRIPGSYWRSLYLSAVTITTLGYGDITPITDRAKLLVALQSILGIVVIGLFVSSVAGQTRRGDNQG